MREREALQARIDANWEAAVGHCFSQNSLDRFLNSPEASYYHSSGEDKGYRVKSMPLMERTDRLETVSVVLLENDRETSVTVEFHINTDGLFYEVKIPQLYQVHEHIQP